LVFGAVVIISVDAVHGVPFVLKKVFAVGAAACCMSVSSAHLQGGPKDDFHCYHTEPDNEELPSSSDFLLLHNIILI